MADGADENSETTRSSEIADKKKADRDLLLQKFRKTKDQLGVNQSSDPKKDDTSSSRSSSISALRSAYGIKKSEPSEQVSGESDEGGPKIFKPKVEFEPKSTNSKIFGPEDTDKTVGSEDESQDESKDGSEDESEDESKDGSEDESVDESENESEDGSEDESQDGSQDESEDGSENESEDESKDESEDGSEDESEDESQDGSEDGSVDESQDGSEDESEDGSEDESKDESKDGSEDESEDESQDGSEDESQDESKDESQDESADESKDESEDGSQDESENESGILTSSDKSRDLLKRLAEKKASEEKIESELGILTPRSSLPETSASESSTLTETPDKEVEREEETVSHNLLQATLEEADVEVESGKMEGTGEENEQNSVEDEGQEIQESPLDNVEPVEETASDLVKDLIEEASTRDIVQDTGQVDEEVESKEKIGFMDKIKNLFKQEEVEVEPYDPELHGPLCIFRGVAGYEELERHWVNEPYAFVVVLFNEEKNHSIYYVVEPELSDFENTFLTEIKDRLRDVLLVEELGEEEGKETVLDEKIRILIKNYAIEVTSPMLAKISYYIKRDFIRFGKLDPLMFDDTIEDISGNGHDTPIFLYHKKHTNIETNITYHEDELNSFIIRLAQKSGKHISVAEPMVDATMGDGSRIQMTLGTTITTHGSTFTIRKFSDVPITPIDLIKWNTFSAESMAYVWLCIENNKSLIYAGGTASGKTSSLNAVSLFIPEKAKVITLEDTRELKLPHINWIPALTRDSFTADERGAVDMYDLLKGALRQRPEFLLVGEVRGKEALTLFQAMSTGHTTFSTMHADSVASAIHRLENPPISVPRTMIQALDIMSIQTQTYSKGNRVRRNTKLVEIVDIDPNTRNIRTNDIFVWDSTTDTFHRTGESKALSDIQMRRGWTSAQVRQELIYRQKVLEYMVNNDINDFQEISGIINAYQATPEKVLKKLKLV